MGDVRGSAALGALAEQVVAGRTDPFRAATLLLDQL
jgi:LAO/AO transport system kinase